MPSEYKPAPPEVTEALEAVIARHPRFNSIGEYDLRIEVLMAWADNGQPVKHHGVPATAKIKIVSGEERATGGPDVRIIVDTKRYADRTPRAREALLAHELYHLEFPAEKGGGVKRDVYDRPAVKLTPDDYCINGFRQVAEWYGDDSAEVRSHRAVGELLSQRAFDFAEAERIADTAAEPKPEKAKGRKAAPRGDLLTPLGDVPGIDGEFAGSMIEDGIDTCGQLAETLSINSDEYLARAYGFEIETVAAARKAVGDFCDTSPSKPAPEPEPPAEKAKGRKRKPQPV